MTTPPARTLTTGRVLVGFDGTPASHHAAVWAAQEAVRRGVPLVVLMAHDIMPTGTIRAGAAAAASVATPAIQDADRARLAQLEIELASACLGLEVETEYVVRPAARALLERTREPGLVVLGGRARGMPGAVLLGGVADAVVTGAQGPVAVIPDTEETAGPVVVGVDRTGSAEDAVAYAYEEARAARAPLRLLHCVDVHPRVPTANALAVAPVAEEHELDAHRAELDALVAHVRGWGDVEVEGRLVLADPGRSLVEASSTARLVVVGSRGRGAVAGLVLGSTSRHLVRGARGPVVVVPPNEG